MRNIHSNQGTAIKLNVGFRLFISGKKKNNKKTWKVVNCKDNFEIEVLYGLTSFKEFQDEVARNCNKGFHGTTLIVIKSIETVSPHIYWLASIQNVTQYIKNKKIKIRN